MLSRREAIYSLGTSLGSVAFSSTLAAEEPRAGDNPLSPSKSLAPAKAKSCIFLMMEGGPSYIGTFDLKPKLAELRLQECTRTDEMQSAMSGGKSYFVASPFKFTKVGMCGADMATNWQHLAGVADELCFDRGCPVDSANHPTAMYQMNAGNLFGGDPAVGSWVTYGLGSDNANLSGFVVLPEVNRPTSSAGGVCSRGASCSASTTFATCT